MKTLEEKKEELKNTMEMLENGVKEVFTSDKFQEYLTTMSKFHNYSVKNILWLQMQNPDARHIAGMKTWNKFGRKVNKGEKSLKVLAPYKHKKEIEMDKINPKTNKAYVDKAGNVIREKQSVEWVSFKVVPVFDIAQTNGKELPTLINELDGNVNNYEYMKDSLVEVAKIPIKFEDIKNGSKGYYHLIENRVVIKEGMSEEQTIKTMVHEITHSRLHSLDNQKDITERSTKEIEAESVAFVVSKHFGIDTDDYSFGYVASWSKDKDLKQLESSLKIIQKEANSLISEVEEKLEDKLNKDKPLEKEPNKSELSISTPYIEIAFSEVEDRKYFNEGEKIPFEKANKRFREAEKEVRDKKAIAKGNEEYYPYLKTKLILVIDNNTKKTMRYDIGDGLAIDLKEFCKKQLDKERLELLNKNCLKIKNEKEAALEM
ncbi:MAG TPA: LPD25 domain-containing protein [Candidatus Paceibacterota bacterium]